MISAARVSLDGSFLGLLTEVGSVLSGRAGPGSRLSFTYDSGWLEREDAVAFTPAVPLRPGPHQSRGVDAFFENLLPEGCMREAAAASRRLPPDALFEMLLEFGGNCVGAVEVVPCARPRPAAAPARNTRTPRGAPRPPGERQAARVALPDVRLPFTVADVPSLAVSALDHALLPGVHRKIPLQLSSERRSARSAAGPGRYILEPQSVAPFGPENEFVTLRIAAAAGVDVVPFGLATLADGSLALLTRRFDRTDDGRKLRVNDLCQLAARRPPEKYDGSAELCADIVRRASSEPLIEVARLYRRFVLAWWVGARLHLKKLALVTAPDGVTRLAPAYGIRCARLDDDEAALALPVNGKRDDLCRRDWLQFADACALRRPAAERVLREVSAALDAGLAAIDEAPLPEAAKWRYAHTLRSRARALAQ